MRRDGKIRVMVTIDPEKNKGVKHWEDLNCDVCEYSYDGFNLARIPGTEDEIHLDNLEDWVRLSYYGDSL